MLARNQDDPDAQPARSRVDEVYCRASDHLRILEFRDGDGVNQTIRTTDDHPFYVVGSASVNASRLEVGDLSRIT